MDENLMEHGGVLVSCVISVAIIAIMSAVIFAISNLDSYAVSSIIGR